MKKYKLKNKQTQIIQLAKLNYFYDYDKFLQIESKVIQNYLKINQKMN